MTAMPNQSRTAARGITLIEVLISIGILAIGLSSVIALVPAGRSEAAKAVVYDRAANLAANVLNDAVTFGLTKPSSVAAVPTGTRMIVFDPLNVGVAAPVFRWGAASAPAASPPPADNSVLKPKGIFAIPSDASTGGEPLLYGLLQNRDDVVYAEAANADDPPSNAFSAGTRSFLGRTSAVLAIAPLAGASGFVAGEPARVSAVVFHNRSLSDPTDVIVVGTYEDASLSPPRPGTIAIPSIPSGRTLRSILRPGTVVFSPSPPAWFQVTMATVDELHSPPLAYVTFDGNATPPANQQVEIALDSVGLAERIVTLEGSGTYGQ